MAIGPTKEQLPELLSSIQAYFREEWDQEVSELKARLLLNFVMKEIAPIAYNKGVRDAESYFRQKLEDLPGSCHEVELSYWT